MADESAYDLVELHEKATQTRIVVIGAGIGGLVSALEFAKLGMQVTVVEAGPRAGGAIRSGEVAGLPLDLGAESFATRGGHVRRLLDELGLSDRVVDPETGAGGAWVAGVPRIGAAPLPKGGVLGIPANPFADDVRRVLGWGGAWRAYVDRLRPVLTIGHADSLGALVASRVGRKVLDRLVAPVTTGVYSASPELIDPDVAAPGLNAAITRAGSLTGGVAMLAEERRSAPGGAVQGMRGGMGALVDALVERLERDGVEVRTGAAAESLERRPGDEWRVHLAADDEDGAEPLDAHGVVVATEEGAARRLLAAHAPGLDEDAPVPGPIVDIVTLVLDAPELDAKPRGTGVLTVPGSHRAKALTHATAKWAWIVDAADPGVHVVRVSFGSASEEPATSGLRDEEVAELALAEASQLLGVTLTRDQLRDQRLERYAQSQPASTIGQKQHTARARAAIRTVPCVGAVGAWLAGTGLAQVVPDAIAETDRVRRAVLFESDAASDASGEKDS
ncbi:protoporphyrinogen oxidase [Microbacterium sp. G2-8]|uniref:protoporphyrinogen oxidase n=1 Tax=Microbacterium sp. G2-8 TaxID=2842454 RepID=UPI001C8ADCFC|nr:protoporphyrinogen oxidase [Microbacterium sp. G2-8]